MSSSTSPMQNQSTLPSKKVSNNKIATKTFDRIDQRKPLTVVCEKERVSLPPSIPSHASPQPPKSTLCTIL